MATIFPEKLPDRIRSDRKRRSECKVYDALAKSLSNNFHVYYSSWWFDLNRRQKDGEADFIIAHKDLGIIFIEVKGGPIRRDDQGNWLSGDIPIKNPIKQARTSKHVVLQAFRKRYQWKYGADSSPYIYVGHFAFLPDTSKPSNRFFGIEMTLDQFGWLEDMENISRKINAFFDYRPKVSRAFPEYEKLGDNGVVVLKELINKEFDWSSNLSTQIELNNYEIKQLTEEQSRFERQHSDFNRLWIEGPAGSGKTSLAFRKLVNAMDVEKEEKKALFLCRNKILAENISNKLKEKVASNNKEGNLNYKAMTFDQFMYDVSGFKRLQSEQKLLSTAFDNCVDKNIKYDLVIVDEAQDFEENWWMIIEAIMHDESILWIFGDSNQRIWDTKKPAIKGIDHSVKLFDVIRNTKQIGDFGLTFYEGRREDVVLKGPSGKQIEIIPSFDCKKDILKRISYLKSYECVKENQIAIIHQKSLMKSKLKDLKDREPSRKYNFSFTDDFNLWKDKILISSIYKFKGMESDVVILYFDDINKLTDEEIYVGVTRTKSHLLIFCENAIEEVIEKRLEILL